MAMTACERYRKCVEEDDLLGALLVFPDAVEEEEARREMETEQRGLDYDGGDGSVLAISLGESPL